MITFNLGDCIAKNAFHVKLMKIAILISKVAIFISIYQWHLLTRSLYYFEAFVLRTVLYGAVKTEVDYSDYIAFCAFYRAYARIGNAYSKQGKLKEAIDAYNSSLVEYRAPEVLQKVQEVGCAHNRFHGNLG